MGWDSAYVRQKYGSIFQGQHYVLYPAKNASRLCVLFSSMGPNRFDRYSWYWDDAENWQDTAYLFIKDDTFRYFLGDDSQPLAQTFRKLIMLAMEMHGLTNKQVFTVGGSMGGYAALYYASFLRLNGAIISNPQLDYASARAHQFENWERQIRSTGSQWQDLSEFIFRNEEIPNIYIEYGLYRADWLAATKLIEAVRGASESLLIARKVKWTGHTVNNLSKITIQTALEFFERHGYDKDRQVRNIARLHPESGAG